MCHWRSWREEKGVYRSPSWFLRGLARCLEGNPNILLLQSPRTTDPNTRLLHKDSLKMPSTPKRGPFRRVLSGRSNPSETNGHSAGAPGPLPMLRVPDNTRNNIVAMLGEFVGTFLFLFFSFAGTQIANTPKPPKGSDPNPAALIFIALSFGVSLTANVWAFYRITGGLFNPCVSTCSHALVYAAFSSLLSTGHARSHDLWRSPHRPCPLRHPSSVPWSPRSSWCRLHTLPGCNAG